MFSKLVQRDFLSVEPHLRRMPDGELLLVCTCGGTAEPAPENRTYFWHSADEGRTWSARQELCPGVQRAAYCTEVFVLGERVVAYIALHSGKFTDWTCEMYESCDSGHHWKSIGRCLVDGEYTFMRSGIALAEGGILMPYQHYPISAEEDARLRAEGKYCWNADIDHVESGVMFSRDGYRFEKRGAVKTYFRDQPVRWQWPEPTIVQLSDGAIAMLLRYNGTGALYRSDSADGGRSWSQPVRTDIPNPDNKPQLLRLDGTRIALLNTPNGVCGFEHRNPLEVWVSCDDLRTWKKICVTCFDGCYSYPSAALSSDGNSLHIAVDFNRHDVYFLSCGL